MKLFSYIITIFMAVFIVMSCTPFAFVMAGAAAGAVAGAVATADSGSSRLPGKSKTTSKKCSSGHGHHTHLDISPISTIGISLLHDLEKTIMDIPIHLPKQPSAPFPLLPTAVSLINATFMPLLMMTLSRQKYTPRTARTISAEYDYIVVGSGSAGAVVASRISEIPCVSVLVLEAGKTPNVLTDVPGLSRAFYQTDIDWDFRTTPLKHGGRALKNRQMPWPQGKTVGGSSVLQAMLAVRGNKKNFDNWAKEGAHGWSYKDVFPYFIKLEDNRDPEFVANGYHGVGGPQTLHRPRYEGEIKRPIFEAAKSMGYEIVDPNGPSQTGWYDLQGFLRSGQKCSTAKGYLVPAENRTNLDILPEATVKKVLIKNGRAVGVQFEFQGSTFNVRAKREVIVSAGTVNSAHLLMLSGIGPKKELDRFKIDVVADLPVGQNLHDHVVAYMNYQLSPTILPITLKLANPISIGQYIQNRTGPLGATEFIQAQAFLENWAITPKTDFPNYELILAEVVAEFAFQIGITPEFYAKFYLPMEGRAFWACLSVALQPRSRGTITLQSKDPSDPPLIDPNYFDDPKDIEDVVEGMKTCNKISNSPQMRAIGSGPFPNLIPGCEKYSLDEEEYLRCIALTLTTTASDPVGTCRMGDPKDPRTVVDPYLRVKGIKGLRVVDASIMPTITSGNIQLPVIMLAEKASDIIKSSIQCHKPNTWEDGPKDDQEHEPEEVWAEAEAEAAAWK